MRGALSLRAINSIWRIGPTARQDLFLNRRNHLSPCRTSPLSPERAALTLRDSALADMTLFRIKFVSRLRAS
jgi:hypothetical protein